MRGKMRLEECNWMDVEAYLKKDDRLILIVGACEQHGYLSLLTDIQIPQALADAASQKSGVLVAPALNFGISPHFTTYPGTISLKVSTFLLAVEDIVRCVYGQGFRRLLILNGHGGNQALVARLVELCNELPELKIEWYAWWIAPSVTAKAASHGLKSYHAGWIEAFPFVQVADIPEGVKEPVVTAPIQNADRLKNAYGDGVFGGPYQAEAGVMQEIFDTAVADVVELLTFAG
jgi:creatinine amidohydrolase